MRCRDCGIAEARAASNRSIWMWMMSGLTLGGLAVAWGALSERLPIVGALGALPVLACFCVMVFQRLFSIARLGFVLADNAGAQRRFKRLAAPHGGVAPASRHGRPTMLRSGAVTLALLVVPASTSWWWGHLVFSRPGTWHAGGCVVIDRHKAAAADCAWR